MSTPSITHGHAVLRAVQLGLSGFRERLSQLITNPLLQHFPILIEDCFLTRAYRAWFIGWCPVTPPNALGFATHARLGKSRSHHPSL